jgi:predicted RNA-binding Zn ribbon-like protein
VAGKRGYVFQNTGGALCLDFANTVGDRPHWREEHVHAYEDVLAWGRQAGALEAGEAAALARAARRGPGRAAEALRRALDLRETVYRIFSALAAGRRAPPKDVAELNAWLARGLRRRRLEAGRDGWRWSWDRAERDLDRPAWAVALSAAELLTSPERSQIRECASGECSWLFVDESRTLRRRWCSMKTCGNRDKARRHYERMKALLDTPKVAPST